MNIRLISRTVVVGMFVGAVGLGVGAVVASGDDAVINGCYNKTNGNLRVVDEGAACRTNETPIAWNEQGPKGPKGEKGDPGPPGPQGLAGAGVKTVAGIINADGTKNGVTPNGFTSVRLDVGRYQIDFPAGTWQSFPVMTATAFGVNGAFGNVIVSSAIGFGDGSARFVVDMIITNTSNTYFDNGFMFTAAAAQPAP